MNNKNHKTLLIVESPSKVKTIGSYFKPSENIEVTATYGHLRSLPSKPNAITFTPEIKYNWIVNKENILKNLMKFIKNNQEIILATDCDREGEAISWHVIQMMKENNINDKIIHRIRFQEITPESIKKALQNKTDININLVYSYLARLTEDYSCGFSITEKMWKKLRCGYSSAGRVQSPTLELIRSREEVIRNFVPKIFYSIDAWLYDQNKNVIEEGSLIIWQKEKINQDTIPNEEKAQEIQKFLLKNPNFIINKSEIKKTKSRKPDPLKTSSLQQIANSRLGFDGKRTMSIAQSLYEGIKVQEKISGLITYMRTDSTFLNEDFVKTAQQYIENKYGKDYVDSQKLVSKKNKNSQEAHEAIRPTNIQYHPDEIKDSLTNEQYLVYSLIWNNTVGALMSPAEYANLNVNLINQDGSCEIKKTFKSLVFDGNLILDNKKNINNFNLNDLKNIFKVNNDFVIEKVVYNQHKTMAPGRYNSGSLVEEMESLGLGRPSTYAPTLETLDKYKYFEKQNNTFVLNPKGAVVSLFLQKYFSRFLKSQSTALMEDNLDKIANGEKSWEKIVKDFIDNLNNNINEVETIENNIILNCLVDDIFKTFNLPKECKKCQSNQIILAVKVNLFFKCLKCNHNVPLDGLLNDSIDETVGDYSLKTSIYGHYLINNTTKKNITIPKNIDPLTLTPEDMVWLDNLPLIVEDNLFFKIGPYSFYLQKDDIKVTIYEKSLEVLKNFTKEHLKNLFESKKDQPKFIKKPLKNKK
jgi:DNA topoisomerase-1